MKSLRAPDLTERKLIELHVAEVSERRELLFQFMLRNRYVVNFTNGE